MGKEVKEEEKKVVYDLARTGIEYPIMPRPDKFIPQNPEFETLAPRPLQQPVLEQYIRSDQERAQNIQNGISNGPLVYDSKAFHSPFYP